MDILSYNDSNYSDGSSGGARVAPPPTPPTFLFLDQTEAQSRSWLGTELYLFKNAFVCYSGYKVGYTNTLICEQKNPMVLPFKTAEDGSL